jgi:hypothetical protein
MARARKITVTDHDIIDVVLRSYTEQRNRAIEEMGKKIEHLKGKYQARLQAAFQSSPKGKALLRLYPNLRAERLDSWSHRAIAFELYDDDGRRSRNYGHKVADELSGEVRVPVRTAKPLRKLRDDLHKAEAELRKMHEDAKRLAWKRAAIYDCLDKVAMMKLHRIVEKAFKARHPKVKL